MRLHKKKSKNVGIVTEASLRKLIREHLRRHLLNEGITLPVPKDAATGLPIANPQPKDYGLDITTQYRDPKSIKIISQMLTDLMSIDPKFAGRSPIQGMYVTPQFKQAFIDVTGFSWGAGPSHLNSVTILAANYYRAQRAATHLGPPNPNAPPAPAPLAPPGGGGGTGTAPVAPPTTGGGGGGGGSSGGRGSRRTNTVVQEIQRILQSSDSSLAADGDWGPATDAAFKSYVNAGPNLVGASKSDVTSDWSINGPKITKVGNKDVSPTYASNAAGVLAFLKDIQGLAGSETSNAGPGVSSSAPDVVAGLANEAETGLAKIFRLVYDNQISVDRIGIKGALRKDTTVWKGVIKGLGGPEKAATHCLGKKLFNKSELKALAEFAAKNDATVVSDVYDQTFMDAIENYFYDNLKKRAKWGPTADVDAVANALKKIQE